ncbi:MAG: DNA-binding protein WhiA [Clostridia bacterium]|nr:DNA-binding protein WhiA [Clostridia bacterium]
MSSFAQTTKDALCEIPVKSECCKSAMLCGMIAFSAGKDNNGIFHTVENENVISLYEMLLVEVLGGTCDISYFGQGYKITISDFATLESIIKRFGNLKAPKKGIFKCEHCLKHYFRGAFLCAGTINSPDSSYHLEIETPFTPGSVSELLSELGIVFKYSNRRGTGVIYVKESEVIEDFLNYIGARSSAFSLMNEKIRRELRNNANRQKNFDTANIKKSVAAGARYLDAIKKLQDEKRMNMLSEELRETATLKLKHPDVGLVELAALHDPKITKSGLYHRLTKIVEFANNTD